MSDIKDRLKFNSGTDKVTKSVADAVSEVLNSGKPAKSRFEKQAELMGYPLQDKPEVAEAFTKELAELKKAVNDDKRSFISAARQAHKEGKKTFMFAGKEYPVKIKEAPVKEDIEEAQGSTKVSLPFPKLKKVGKFTIGLAYPAPNTLYSIKFRNYDFMISPGDIKDLIKILSQRDIVTKNPPGMAKLPEEVEVKEDNTNNKSDDGDGLDKVQPKAVKKKFKDRKDKDIDNDGDVDSSDKFLHKKRKAISKAIDKKEDASEMKYDARSKSFKETLRRLGYVKEKSLIYNNKKAGK